MTERPLAKRGIIFHPLCLFFVLIIAAGGCKKKPAAQPPPPEVQVITLEAKDVPIYQDWVGSLEGYVNAGIRAQVTGYLLAQNYKEGAVVKKGDQLFQIDPRPFQAVLDQAKAKLAQDRAQVGKTELDVKRYTPLAKEQAISQEELDDAVQANLAAHAQIKADDATVERAKLNLDFTKITSPVDGIAGTALAQIGDLVSTGSGLLTTISQLDPMRVYFNVNEDSYLTFWRDRIHDGTNVAALELQLVLSDGSIYPLKGKFFFAGRQVDTNTGTLQIAGLFPNPDLLLRPGQYGRVRVQTSLQRGAILVPQRAVTELQGSYQIAVVDDQNKVHIKAVKVGDQTGSNWIIENGLKPGERVVVEGLLKAKEGATVDPKPFGAPAQSQAPAPAPATNGSARN